jgi:nucleotide-binding universal stress UspA family protein
MDANRRGPRIVVGYDGSPAASAALRLALDRAGANGALYIVHGYDAPGDYWGGEQYDMMLAAALRRGEQVIAQAAADDPRLATVEHELELVAGAPSEVIANVAEVRGADEIIVGTRGFGRLRGALGSVAHALLHDAGCPVTVVTVSAVARMRDAEARAARVET